MLRYAPLATRRFSSSIACSTVSNATSYKVAVACASSSATIASSAPLPLLRITRSHSSIQRAASSYCLIRTFTTSLARFYSTAASPSSNHRAVFASSPPPILFVIGGPGAGKGTQCNLLAREFGTPDVRGEDGMEDGTTSDANSNITNPSSPRRRSFGLVHISIGAVLRRSHTLSSTLSSTDRALLQHTLSTGSLLPAYLTVRLLSAEIERCRKLQEKADPNMRLCFVVDGFPRNMENIRCWRQAVKESEGHLSPLDTMLLLDCDKKNMISRLTKRGRSDDTPEIIARRIAGYARETVPAIDWFIQVEGQQQNQEIDRTNQPNGLRSVRWFYLGEFDDDAAPSTPITAMTPPTLEEIASSTSFRLLTVDGRGTISEVQPEMRKMFAHFLEYRMGIKLDEEREGYPTKPSSSQQTSASHDLTLPMPPLHHGILSRPMTWAELTHAISHNRLDVFGRTRAVRDAYNQHRDEVLKEWTSLGDFVLHHVFGVSRILTPEGKYCVRVQGGMAQDKATMTLGELKAASCDQPSSTNNTAANLIASAAATINSQRVTLPPTLPFLIKWTPNEFPYSVEDGISHDLLWCTSGALDDAIVREQIERRLPRIRYDTTYFINPMHQRSIKDVFHAHVFYRARSSSLTKEPVVVRLFTRKVCSLCEPVKFILKKVASRYTFRYEEIDIDRPENSHWHALYTNDIPVVDLNGIEIARHGLKEKEFVQKLEQLECPRTQQDPR